ncbi:MAG: hypothetical protein HY909_14560 [Deltaproteobacteria bacterium]|nr:hypothetical protein [Deltaproteobacteria bacterium]
MLDRWRLDALRQRLRAFGDTLRRDLRDHDDRSLELRALRCGVSSDRGGDVGVCDGHLSGHLRSGTARL